MPEYKVSFDNGTWLLSSFFFYNLVPHKNSNSGFPGCYVKPEADRPATAAALQWQQTAAMFGAHCAGTTPGAVDAVPFQRGHPQPLVLHSTAPPHRCPRGALGGLWGHVAQVPESLRSAAGPGSEQLSAVARIRKLLGRGVADEWKSGKGVSSGLSSLETLCYRDFSYFQTRFSVLGLRK